MYEQTQTWALCISGLVTFRHFKGPVSERWLAEALVVMYTAVGLHQSTADARGYPLNARRFVRDSNLHDCHERTPGAMMPALKCKWIKTLATMERWLRLFVCALFKHSVLYVLVCSSSLIWMFLSEINLTLQAIAALRFHALDSYLLALNVQRRKPKSVFFRSWMLHLLHSLQYVIKYTRQKIHTSCKCAVKSFVKCTVLISNTIFTKNINRIFHISVLILTIVLDI